MKIGINGYEAVVPRFGFTKEGLPNRVGSGEVCFQLLLELSQDTHNTYIVYLPAEPTNDMPKESETWQYRVIPARRLWTFFALRNAVNRDHLDLFFNPTHYSPLFLNCPQILAVLDVSYKHFPKLFKKKDLYKLSLWGKYSLKRAKRVITISQSSKDDIIKQYHVPGSHIAVVHLGIKHIPKGKSSFSMETIQDKYGFQKPYILFVGTLQPRKNVKRLIEAFSRLHNEKISLVIVGKKGWMYEDILKAPEEFGVKSRVHFLHEVTDEELPLLYKNAECFVLPSLYEGFGLPVLEAMQYGCPVITSNVSSLPEAGGDAAEYVDPEDTKDIADTIDQVLESKELREKMIKKGYKQVEKFSWEKSAKEVLDVFKEVGHHE